MAEVRRGRKDLSDDERAEGPPDIGLNKILAQRLESDPDTMEPQITDSLGVSPQTAISHLRDGLGMKCFHLR
jgi:hypothetical protein